MRALTSLATYLFVTALAVLLPPSHHAFGGTAIGEILPLGDSITDGEAGTGGGYRAQLYSLLSSAGDIFNLVGSSTNNSTAALTASGQDSHEGHSGYRIDQIDGNLTGLVSSAPAADTNNGGYWLDGSNATGREGIFPDLILLHIGTNDATQGRTAAQMQGLLQSLLTKIKTNRPNAKVIVASLILRTDNQTRESTQMAYNNAIPGIVSAMGANFRFLDMHAVLGPTDLADGLHPNQGGYDKMANAWAGALHSLAAVEPLQIATAVSRKTHGSAGNYDLNLPLTGAPGVECRTNGDGTDTLLFTFNNHVKSGTAAITAGNGVISGNPTFADNVMSVNLTGVSNGQRITIALNGVKDAYAQTLAGTSVNMDVLVGDTTGDGKVNSSDISQTKSQSGHVVSDANFRADVTTDNAINSSDIGTVKAQSGTAIP